MSNAAKALRDAGSRQSALRLLRLIARVVPSRDRAAWLQEWEAELAHRRDLRLRSVLGSFFDAAWMRRQFPRDAEIIHDVRHPARSGARRRLRPRRF